MSHSGQENTPARQTKNSQPILECLTAYAENREKEGVFPYDGQWLSRDEITHKIRRKHLKSRAQLWELGFLFGLVYVIAIASLLLISKLTY